jgi:hypothetical protein
VLFDVPGILKRPALGTCPEPNGGELRFSDGRFTGGRMAAPRWAISGGGNCAISLAAVLASTCAFLALITTDHVGSGGISRMTDTEHRTVLRSFRRRHL